MLFTNMPTPKTIITYLVDGNPQWIKTVELSNWIGKALSIPRVSLKDAKDRSETKQPALYFLFGEDENENKMAYIWEAENLIQRMADHDSKKDFWDIVVAFISTSNSLTKWDVKYLEAKAVERAKKNNKFLLQNSTTPIPNNLPEFQQSAMEEFLENVDLLISAMGYPILKEIAQKKKTEEKKYFLVSKDAKAEGVYIQDGFVLLKWSTLNCIEAPSFGWKAQKSRSDLLNKDMISKEWDVYMLLEDYICSSPSHAASIVTGRSTNGWTSWKDINGKTLHENERQTLI